MTEILSLVVGLLLVAACGGFVAAEFALLTVDRPTVDKAVAAGDKGAVGLSKGLKTLSTQLSGAQLGITITNLAIGFLAEPAIGRLLRGPLEDVGLPGPAATGVSYAVAFALSTAVTMIFGELVPKNLAIARPLETGRAVQGFMRGFTTGTRPAIAFLNGSANWLLRRMGIEPQEELASARSGEELTSLVARSAEQGTLEEGTAVLVQRSLVFGTRRAEDAMTPRVRLHTLSAEDSLLELLEAVHASGKSRFPVLDSGPDDVLGVVHARQVLDVEPGDRSTTTLRTVARTPLLVPETMELDSLLDELKATPLQMALVVDEFGGVSGVVTLEDLIEEIVGEVVDEHDSERPPGQPDPDGGWILSGLLRPDEASRLLDVALPEDDEYETVAGLVGLHLNRLPQVGDEVEVAAGLHGRARVRFRVEGLDGLRVDELHAEVVDHGLDESVDENHDENPDQKHENPDQTSDDEGTTTEEGRR